MLTCPKEFCFHWVNEGDKHLPIVLDNIEYGAKLAKKMKPSRVGYCGCSFGECIREKDNELSKDWFEPNEPLLDKTMKNYDNSLK